jgi:uncharacterized protein
MRLIASGLLLLCFGEMWYFVRTDMADYAAFKLLTETADRQRRYRVWALKSFLLFSAISVIGLGLLGRFSALSALPAEFGPAFRSLRSFGVPGEMVHRGFLVGFGSALLVGAIAGQLALKFVAKKKVQLTLGDIEPLMPRNWAETFHTGLLSLNAGLSEELFFRLLLPLLLTILFGNVIAAFLVATLVFGAIHMYQGAVGVVATTALGAAFSLLYLWTGSIWVAISVHAALDLLSLVVRPSIARAFAN